MPRGPSVAIVAPMADWLERLRGRFLVFDGPDGSGKTTQFARFAGYCRERGVPVCEVREPGGTAIGERIRSILLDPANADMSLRCEMMLYMASRAQLVEQCIDPALARGELVLADRFISSTFAYQGAAGGLPAADILAVGRVAIPSRWPDLTVIFDVDEKTAAARMHGGKRNARKGAPTGATLFADRMERRGADFHRRVRQGFLDQAKADPDRFLVVDAAGETDAVFDALLGALERRL